MPMAALAGPLGDRCVAVRGNCLTHTTCPPDRCRAPVLLRERVRGERAASAGGGRRQDTRIAPGGVRRAVRVRRAGVQLQHALIHRSIHSA